MDVDNWTIKKAEHQRIDAFKLWCWKKLLRVPWSARRSNQSILKEISPEYSEAEALILWPTDVKNWCLRKDPDAEKDWRQEKKGMIEDEMVRCHYWLITWVWASSGSWWWNREAWRAAVHGVTKSRKQLSDWTDWLTYLKISTTTRYPFSHRKWLPPTYQGNWDYTVWATSALSPVITQSDLHLHPLHPSLIF